MPDVSGAVRTRRGPIERVRSLVAADFPGIHLALSERPEDLDRGVARAVVVPAAELPGSPAEGKDHFAFPAGEPVEGLGLAFSADDPLLLSLRRFYLPPVTFAGAGPGGVGSMTVAAVKAVAAADVILVDALCGEEVLEPRRPDACVVHVGKRCGGASTKQEVICRAIGVHARRGRRVLRLKGGDPAVFGRLDEELETVRDLSLSWRVIPGIGAASSAAAWLGQPLTVREVASELIFSTGRLAGGGRNPFPIDDASAPAIALYMSRRVLAERMADLVGAGYPDATAVAVVEKLGSPATRAVTGTIRTIAAAADREGIGTPAVVLVGAQFRRPAHLPLHGIRVWLPGEKETAETQREPLEEAGAVCEVLPLIEPEPLPVDEAAILGKPFDWVVFTSKKAVDYLFELLGKWGLDARWLPRIAAIGAPAIEKLRARGIVPNLIPPEPTRVALSASLLRQDLAGARILLPFSAVAPDHVRTALAPHAAEVVRADLYTIGYRRVPEVPAAHVVLFTSETTVKSAKEGGLIPEIRRRGMLVGGIGPGTCGRLAREGLPPAIVPDGTDPASLARAVRRYFARLDTAVTGAKA